MKMKISQLRGFRGPWQTRQVFASAKVKYCMAILLLISLYLFAATNFFGGALRKSVTQSTELEYYDIDVDDIQKTIIKDCMTPPNVKTFTESPVHAKYTQTGLPAHKMVLTIKAIYNEEDVLGENLLWYLDQGFRRFSMLDTGSTDGTIDIITNFRKEYKQIAEVVLVTFRKFSRKITRYESMMFLFSTQLWPDAPWIFVVDTDEFVVSNNGLLQDMQNIPESKDILRCHVDQYCPLQNYTVQDDEHFYKKQVHLVNTYRSFKQKCIGRPSYFYKVNAGHHSFSLLQFWSCLKKLEDTSQLYAYTTEDFEVQLRNATSKCKQLFEQMQIWPQNECKLQDVTLINLPKNNKIFQQNVQLQDAFEDLPINLLNINGSSYAKAAQTIYNMFETYVKDGTCTSKTESIAEELYSVFYPPIRRSVYYYTPNITLLELQSEFCSFMKTYVLSQHDMVLVIQHSDPAIDLTNSIKWHFALGFRRFFIFSTFLYDDDHRQVIDQISKELGSFASIATMEFHGQINYSRGGLIDIVNQFIIYSQIWAVKSVLSFYILDHQILFSEKASIFGSIANAGNKKQCKVYSTQVTDCSQGYSYQSIFSVSNNCVNLDGIYSHQALTFNRRHYLQLQFSPAQYQSKPQANYYSIQSNMTKFINALSSFRVVKKLRYASCRDYNISFREYPIRSKSHFIRKFSSGGSWKYRTLRQVVSKYKDEYQAYEYIYAASRPATSNGVYDPLPIERAINNTKKLKNTYVW